MKNAAFAIAVLPGDGIGVEVMDACLRVLEALERRIGGFALDLECLPGGARYFRETGAALDDATFAKCARADAILFGAMGWPDIRYADGTEIAPQLDLRFKLKLYAGVRPIRAVPGTPAVLADSRAKAIDFVILRESTEGMFASRGKGVIEADREARDTMAITRATSERLFDFAFRLARRRQKRRRRPSSVTCVDKANVFRSFAFFRRIFEERAQLFPDVEARSHYVDAMALDLVRKPWDFDVIVTENLFGDILSDLGAGLIGGMGMAPSADIGDEHAMFQPSHGSAPDIAGRGTANPTAMLLSAAMMLDWLGERHDVAGARIAAVSLENAVFAAFAEGAVRPMEFGGVDGTVAIAKAVIERIASPLATG
ncbi:MAG TPA: isocitrate/isopropylmalate dehydrogenase family protein [Alphaproteobacteria bacterium]|nr:isocitrate/isopropylmalate dehydrogenase family protein [Alphaproteobacteria bacterium]